MVDVHVLTLPGDRTDWMALCLDSLANEPVYVHHMPGIRGDTAAARTRAFTEGDHPYVAFVDPDDYVESGIFDVLVNVLERNPEAVVAYSDQMLIDEEGLEIIPGWSTDPRPFYENGWPIELCRHQGQYIHHLTVIRRSAIEKCLPLRSRRAPECVLMGELAQLGWLLHVPQVGYYWRQHRGNTFTTYSAEELSEVEHILQHITHKKGA